MFASALLNTQWHSCFIREYSHGDPANNTRKNVIYLDAKDNTHSAHTVCLYSTSILFFIQHIINIYKITFDWLSQHKLSMLRQPILVQHCMNDR